VAEQADIDRADAQLGQFLDVVHPIRIVTREHLRLAFNRAARPRPGPVSTRKAMAISFGSRPAFSAKPCMRARPVLKRLTVFIGNCGFVPTGYQPWPYLTVRRNAGPLSPPTQIG